MRHDALSLLRRAMPALNFDNRKAMVKELVADLSPEEIVGTIDVLYRKMHDHMPHVDLTNKCPSCDHPRAHRANGKPYYNSECLFYVPRSAHNSGYVDTPWWGEVDHETCDCEDKWHDCPDETFE